jgi:tRNA-dihydrouridine synthase A
VASEAGCAVFIVHAPQRLAGRASQPKENREVPPLRYGLAYQLKQDFPHLTIVVNGGITQRCADSRRTWQQVDGVMVGREAYYQPWLLSGWDALYFDAAPQTRTREAVEEAMVVVHMERALGRGRLPLVRDCPPHAGL